MAQLGPPNIHGVNQPRSRGTLFIVTESGHFPQRRCRTRSTPTAEWDLILFHPLFIHSNHENDTDTMVQARKDKKKNRTPIGSSSQAAFPSPPASFTRFRSPTCQVRIVTHASVRMTRKKRNDRMRQKEEVMYTPKPRLAANPSSLSSPLPSIKMDATTDNTPNDHIFRPSQRRTGSRCQIPRSDPGVGDANLPSRRTCLGSESCRRLATTASGSRLPARRRNLSVSAYAEPGAPCGWLSGIAPYWKGTGM